MKYPFIAVTTGLVAMTLTGCIVVGVDRHNHEYEEPAPITATADSVVFTEINSAASLQFENNRVDALKAIAARPGLKTDAQVHLVHKTFAKLSFENFKVAVLETLIKNPSFSNPAKQSILTSLEKFSFENNKTELLTALNLRGELKD